MNAANGQKRILRTQAEGLLRLSYAQNSKEAGPAWRNANSDQNFDSHYFIMARSSTTVRSLTETYMRCE